MKDKTRLYQPYRNKKIYISVYYEQWYISKLNILDEMSKFVERQKLLKLTQEEIESLNRPIMSKETEVVMKTFPHTKGSDGFSGEFYQTFKKQLIPLVHKLFKKVEEEKGILPNTFYEANITLILKLDKNIIRKTTEQCIL